MLKNKCRRWLFPFVILGTPSNFCWKSFVLFEWPSQRLASASRWKCYCFALHRKAWCEFTLPRKLEDFIGLDGRTRTLFVFINSWPLPPPAFHMSSRHCLRIKLWTSTLTIFLEGYATHSTSSGCRGCNSNRHSTHGLNLDKTWSDAPGYPSSCFLEKCRICWSGRDPNQEQQFGCTQRFAPLPTALPFSPQQNYNVCLNKLSSTSSATLFCPYC